MDAGSRSQPAAVAEFVAEHVDDVVQLWRELVTWDPSLPTGTTPAVATAVVTAVARALGRPQPLGWGTDPEVEKVIEVFATASGPVEVAIGHLVCLREALRRSLAQFEAGDPSRVAENEAAVNMIIDRAIAHAATVATARLRDVTLADEYTQLPNQRALERDLAREVSRADRHGRGLTVVVFDRPTARDADPDEPDDAAALRQALQELARAVQAAVRAGDSAYVAGGRIVVLLSETSDDVAPALSERVERIMDGALLCGAATFPADGSDASTLLVTAHDRCGSAGATAG